MDQERASEAEKKIMELIKHNEDMIEELGKEVENEDDEIILEQDLQGQNYHAGRKEGLKIALAVFLYNEYFYKLKD